MEYIHVRSLEKYHPSYKDRDLKWAKFYFTIVQGDPEMEVVSDEIDKWRFVALVCLELEAKKPLPNTDEYWVKKFNIKKRPMSMTLKMLHNFIDVVTEDAKLCDVDKSKIREDKSRGECVTHPPPTNRFLPPTLEQITEYCKERNSPINPSRFFDYYQANGWVRGKGRIPIKDWRACVRTWESRNDVEDVKQPRIDASKL